MSITLKNSDLMRLSSQFISDNKIQNPSFDYNYRITDRSAFSYPGSSISCIDIYTLTDKNTNKKWLMRIAKAIVGELADELYNSCRSTLCDQSSNYQKILHQYICDTIIDKHVPYIDREDSFDRYIIVNGRVNKWIFLVSFELLDNYQFIDLEKESHKVFHMYNKFLSYACEALYKHIVVDFTKIGITYDKTRNTVDVLKIQCDYRNEYSALNLFSNSLDLVIDQICEYNKDTNSFYTKPINQTNVRLVNKISTEAAKILLDDFNKKIKDSMQTFNDEPGYGSPDEVEIDPLTNLLTIKTNIYR